MIVVDVGKITEKFLPMHVRKKRNRLYTHIKDVYMNFIMKIYFLCIY